MNVRVTDKAQSELNDVWQHNAEQRGDRWADDDLDFLKGGIARLAAAHPRTPHRRLSHGRTDGDGHLAIYEVGPSTRTISVLHVFHTQQDASGRLSGER